jgi:hypothetical protein
LRRRRRLGEFHASVLAGRRQAFYREVARSVAAGETALLAAFRDGEIVGTVQVQFISKPNQRHRAEIAKMLVHRSARRAASARP